MSTTSNDSTFRRRPRLGPEGAEAEDQVDLDRNLAKSKTLSTTSVASVANGDKSGQGCLPNMFNFNGNFTLDVRRKPISVMAAKSFWNGVSEIRDVLTNGNPLLEESNATFYVEKSSRYDHCFHSGVYAHNVFFQVFNA